MKHNTAFYSEIESTVKTGDLILFHGMSMSSKVNELFTGCEWSHVGMIIRPEDIGIVSTDKLLLWESNTLVNLDDVELEKPKEGPMLVDLHQRIMTDLSGKHDNKFIIRYNTCEVSREMLVQLRTFIKAVHMDSFPKTDFDLRKEVFEGVVLDIQVDNGDYFCSQLIADTYMQMGIITSKYPTNSYEPKDFSDKGSLAFTKRGQLIEGPLLDVSKDKEAE